ncbi:YheV family putative zinc ribbon protein [Paraferrimonas sedimenticola]|uniref:DNA-binding protein n=1 Tax=Paraferrimonas sedimenticola TaxID=375674 RepID=A0AA37RVD7_9GAMM|nr:YheV family putative zinc ribbon protein [Paraferrimonas sedimenticola]GLP95778.1 DNA-binding protein [Paraferrimonas sedimenticola]
MTKLKKRFIAGARCPKCNAQDSIMLFMQNGVETIECSDCGHTQTQGSDAQQKSAGGDLIGVFKPE